MAGQSLCGRLLNFLGLSQEPQQKNREMKVCCGSAFGASGVGGSSSSPPAAKSSRCGLRRSPGGFLYSHKHSAVADLPSIQVLKKLWVIPSDEQQIFAEEVRLHADNSGSAPMRETNTRACLNYNKKLHAFFKQK